MQWVEWDKQGMSTGAFLPISDVTPFFIGGYANTEPYPNPLTTAA
jgi:hypothetical protein